MTRTTAAERVVDSERTEDGDRGPERTVSMEEAVGYATLPCAHETTVVDAITLTHDRVFALVDRYGNIAPPGRCSLGLFEDDTRLLSHYELRGAGTDPVKLSAQVVQPYHAQIDLAVTDHAFGGDPWDPKHAVYFKRELTVDDALFERLTLTNYVVRPIDYWLELRVACDFADIFEVRGWKRDARGTFSQPEIVDDRTIRFSYRGRDGKTIESIVSFRDRPDVLEPHRARWAFRLEPGRPVELAWSVGGRAPKRGTVFDVALDTRRARLAEAYDEWRGEGSRWASDVEAFDSTMTRAIDDLRSLYIGSGDDAVISAGIPWYSTVFGRDSIITSLETMILNPGIAVDTLRYLARHQGTQENAFTE